MIYDLFGFVLIAALALVGAAAWARRPQMWVPAKLLLAAIALRIVGAIGRYEVLYRVYHGVGDATGYFRHGNGIASMIRGFELSPFSFDFWTLGNGPSWGTEFVTRISSLVLVFIGPTMRGEFLVFALLSFLGLYAMALGVRKVQGGTQPVVVAAWIWLWPSLWFWPSSVGKEAILLLAVGLVSLGYAGRHDRIHWLPYFVGLGLSFCVRPHVAAALCLATVAAHWMGSWKGFGGRRLVEAILFLVVTVVAFNGMKAQFGLADADLEGLTEYVQFRAQQTQQGGSEIGTVPSGALAIPMAFVNVWMRPFLWEAHNLTNFVAALELVVLWGLVWVRRRELRIAIGRWRRHRLLRFGVPLVMGYTLMIGLTFSNLGIIARQRSLVFPFVLMLILSAPSSRRRSGGRPLGHHARRLAKPGAGPRVQAGAGSAMEAGHARPPGERA